MNPRAALIPTIIAAAIVISQAAPTTQPTTTTAPTRTDWQAYLTNLGRRNIQVHDPSAIVKCKDDYWIFFTGRSLPSIHSKDMITWTRGPRTFTMPPTWFATAVPGNRGGDCWAPDLRKIGDRYFLFYSVSTFGRNTSAIGLMTNPTLDPTDPAYKWTDSGAPIIQSRQGEDDFNCIDPSAFKDTDGNLYLSFGSFFSGIKLVQLDPTTGKRIAPTSPIYNLAKARAIEASYLYRKDNYYYLFASFGLCCRGFDSTYDTRVARSEKITGPYLDQSGHDMLNGGGTIITKTDGPLIGPGQAGIFEENGKTFFSCHFYDGTTYNAYPRLSIRPLTWTNDGWPVIGKLDSH